jgi:EAL domain-containing protein (putative c-di-GMP-specific phosphodiesterase class I)
LSPRFTIGRGPGHGLCLANPTVSGDHAELAVEADRVYVRDLNSTNGTFLNGRRIEAMEIATNGDLLQFGTASFQIRWSPEIVSSLTRATDVADEALAVLQFDKLMSEPAVHPHYQPIVRLADSYLVGYEVLARSRLLGLQNPEVMFRTAGVLNAESELSRLMRREGLRAGERLTAGTPRQMYLNTHPSELKGAELTGSLRELRAEFPDVSIMLEIHEAAVTSTLDLAELRKELTALGIGLAYDDFGAGQPRLQELADVPPDVIKFDIHLIHGLPHASLERRRMVQSLVQIAKDLDVVPLAEGVETQDEAEVCYDLGFELAQGFYFGKPAPAKTWLQQDPRRICVR